jgi:hypothetical protein
MLRSVFGHLAVHGSQCWRRVVVSRVSVHIALVIKFRMSYLLSQGLQPLILLDMQSHNRFFL